MVKTRLGILYKLKRKNCLKRKIKEMICEKCSNRNKRNICKICHEGDCYEEMPSNNYERIIKMDIVDLAKFIGAIKCNAFQIECGYPTCPSMNGNYCVGVHQRTDEDILNWLQSKRG